MVTEHSSDQEIIEAINKAGEHRYHWRQCDWPEEGENNTKSWVKPGDIGFSTRDNPALLKRLRKMVKEGLLEERSVTVTPRFRVVQH